MMISPPNRINPIVDECVKRCLASDRPLRVLTQVLDAETIDARLTSRETEEIVRRTISRIVAAKLGEED